MPRGSLQIGLPCLEKNASSPVRTPDASNRSSRPSSINSRTACGSTLMPTPSGFNAGTLSKTLAAMPIWCRLSASVSPPMPPPAMRTVMNAPQMWMASWHGRRQWATAKRRSIASGRAPFRTVKPAPGFQHKVTQPDRAGIEPRPRRIEHELLVYPGIERRRDGFQRQRPCKRRYQPVGNKRHEIAARHDMERFQIARHHQRNTSLDPVGQEPVFDQVRVLAADDDGDMPRIQEDIAPPQPGSDRVTAPHRERIAVGIEKLAVK